MSVFRIFYAFSRPLESHRSSDKYGSVFIKTELQKSQVADIVTGLQFYLEDNTRFGKNCIISCEAISYLLCNYFGCEESNKDEWYRLAKEELEELADNEDDDLSEEELLQISEYCVEMHSSRASRCGPDYKRYMEPIQKLNDTNFIKALCAFYNSEACLNSPMPTVATILVNYSLK